MNATTSGDAIELRIDPRVRSIGAGQVRRLLPYARRRMVGPFIFADLIGPEVLAPGSAIDVDAHPHIGISTLTYLFSGRLVHRDSTGAIQTIEPRAVNWMTAGSGVSHTERSHPDDRSITRIAHGLQTWVALPDEDEEVDAWFQHAPAAEIPMEARGGSTVRVAAGTGWGHHSPVTGSSPLVLAEISLTDSASIPVDLPHRERAVLAVDGQISVNDSTLTAGQLAVLQPDPRAVLGGVGTAIVLGGDPVGPRQIWWNFVHSDPERIEHAKADWAAQRFPAVPGDHDPFVPLPG